MADLRRGRRRARPGSNWPVRCASWPPAVCGASSVRFEASLGAGDPGGRGQGSPGRLRRPALGQGGEDPRASGHRAAHGRSGGRASTPTVSTSRGRTARPGSRPVPPSGPPASRPPPWPACWPRPRVPRWTGPAGSPSCPTSPCRGTPKCSPSGDMASLDNAARCGRSGHAGWPPRRQHDPPSPEGEARQAVPLPGPRECGHHRPLPGHRERQGDPSERLSGLGGVDVRPPRHSSPGSATGSPPC